MAYLTYNEYLEYGGSLEESVFQIAERKSERKLNFFTQDRLISATTIPDCVKELMTEFVDRIARQPIDGNVSAYSNGVESFSFIQNRSVAFDSELMQLATEYLPIEYVSAYVGGSYDV